uniref:Putative RNA-directed DNA polymerase n=1 Tax=Sipha flava TaxID=143950 RepID=A0A2S2QF50_9HEMI
MNWDQFRESIDQNINLNTFLKTPDNIVDAVQKFTEIIQTAAWKSLFVRLKCQKNSLTVPAHISELITQKRHARDRWQHTRFPSDKSIYNNLTSFLKRTLNKLRNDSFNDWISSLTTKDGSM